MGTQTLEVPRLINATQFLANKNRWIGRRLGWHRKKLQIIFALALVLRLIVCACAAEDRIEPSRHHWNFAYETGNIANSLATGKGFADPLFGPTGPSAWLAPAYPYLLSVIFRAFGSFTLGSALAILAFNSLCGALTCVPIFFVARKIFGETAATSAAFGWAFFPYSIYLNAYLVWDVALCTLLLTLQVWATLELAESRQQFGLRWSAYGAVWGLAALTNPAILAPLPLLSCWAAIRQKQGIKRSVAYLTVAALAFLLVIAPWAVRNYRVFNNPFLLKSNFWLEVAVGNLGSHAHWWNDNQHPSRNIGELREMMRVGELNYMQDKKQESLEFIRTHAKGYAILCVRRAVYIWSGFWSARMEYLVEEPMDPINILVCTTFSFFAFWGVARGLRRGIPNLFPCIATMIALPIIHYLTHPFVSYRHPIDPEIVLFAAYAVWPVLASEWERSYLRTLLVRWRVAEEPVLIPFSARKGLVRDSPPRGTAMNPDMRILPEAPTAERSQQQG